MAKKTKRGKKPKKRKPAHSPKRKKKPKTKKRAPSPKGGKGDGRDPKTGRFLPGWKGGPGNPHGRETAQLRAALMESISPEDIQAAVGQLIKKAKRGNLTAIRELLDRAAGRPGQTMEQTIKNETGIDFSKMDGKQIKAKLMELWREMPEDVKLLLKGADDVPQLEDPGDAGVGPSTGG